MKQQILYGFKVSIAVITVLLTLIMLIVIVSYLFIDISEDSFALEELIPMILISTISIFCNLYHYKTFYLVTKVPRGETFQFKNVKKIYWLSPWFLSGLLWFALLMILVDEFSIGFTFDSVDWIIFGLLFTISIVSAVEVWDLKKIYKQKGIDYTAILDQIGQE